MQTFNVSRGWKIFYIIVIPPMLALMGWFMMMPFLKGRSDQTGLVLVCLLMGGGALLLFLYVLLSLFMCRFEIHPDKIKNVDPFRAVELEISNIAGFRFLPTQYVQSVLIIPKNNKQKKIKTALAFENKEILIEWLCRNLTNLDHLDYQEEINNILNNARFGATGRQRQKLLDNAGKWSKTVNIIGVTVCLWAIFWPHPYRFAVWVLMLLPLFSLGLLYHFEGVMQFDSKPQSVLPGISPAFMMPCLGLALRALLDFKILSWKNFWLHFVLLSFSLYLLTLLCAKDVRESLVKSILVIIFCVIYGYAAVICLNGILDKSSPAAYKAQIIDKRISKGRRIAYHLKLSAWGPEKQEKELDVGKAIYDRYKIGDRLDVRVKQGKLNIPWYFVR